MSSCVDSLVAEQVGPPAGGGSIPTSTLHVRRATLREVQPVVERLHYSHSCFGVTSDACYAAQGPWEHRDGFLYRFTVVGAAIFGKPAAYNVTSKYAQAGRRLLELRRFVLENGLPRNSESRCLAFMLRDLKHVGVDTVLSYADPLYGHSGVIYAACGFRRLGKTAPRTHYEWLGKRYPDRNLHQVNFPFHRELRIAVQSGEAVPVHIPGKIIWVKDL